MYKYFTNCPHPLRLLLTTLILKLLRLLRRLYILRRRTYHMLVDRYLKLGLNTAVKAY